MERAKKIIRRAIFTFLKNYQYFTSSTPIFLLLIPFSVSSLFYRALLIRSPGPLDLLDRPSSIFLVVSCFSFSVVFLVKAKSSILQAVDPFKPFPSPSSLHKPLLEIQSFNLLLLCFLSASCCLLKSLVANPNHALFTILFGTIYYTIYTNMTVVFNLALVISETRNLPAYVAIREAFLLRVQDSSTTLILALASSMISAAIESLFRCRVVRALGPKDSRRAVLSVSLEGLLIAYLYSIIIVLDTTACFLFISDYGSEPKTSSSASSDEAEICCSDSEAAGKVVEDSLLA
ncbi:uncharacterized protein LOC116207785 [Punica granatum]|uniref:Protein RFT1 homolog n=2 Tax=Punica granatum TaxID=22663 RepID=A0A218VVZ1_PUNGR|nr:uncharacterized protein LOC116207785 [Punica granatum]OWM64556.1 hypothetical protein CDL15_Pgr020523 [Punica granatum]PKI47920.1 hypothetical protein CRG98_031704 [Punica granatum]